MSIELQKEIAIIVLWNFFALLINVISFIILYIKANRNSSLKAFFMVQLSVSIWLIGKILKTVSPTVELRWFFIVLYYFGICLLEASFLDFAVIYSMGRKLNNKIRALIYFIAFIQFMFVATNPYHFLFYSKYNFWSDDFGVLFYVHVIINYVFLIIGMVLCSRKFNKQVQYQRKFHKYLVSLAILIPIVFNFIYITRVLASLFKYLGIQVFDITPIVYTWSLMLFLYATFKYEFFSLNPIMRHEITEKLDTPLVIFDELGNIIYYNHKFEKMLESSIKEVTVNDFIHSKVLSKIDSKSFIIEFYSNYYSCNIEAITTINSKNYIVGFTNITPYQAVRNELHLKNEQLAKSNTRLKKQIEMLKETSHIGARNFVARELHDIIGHSLVVTMKLLEVCKITCNKKAKIVKDSLQRAKESIISGFDQMKKIVVKSDNELRYNTHLLERELKSMLRIVEVSGTQVKFFIRGKKIILNQKVFDIIKKVSTELVTNTLKHAHSTNILLAINISVSKIDIQYMDNGIGKDKLVKGNGLNGIESRLDLVKGKIQYITADNEGFIANIIIPI